MKAIVEGRAGASKSKKGLDIESDGIKIVRPMNQCTTRFVESPTPRYSSDHRETCSAESYISKIGQNPTQSWLSTEIEVRPTQAWVPILEPEAGHHDQIFAQWGPELNQQPVK